VFVIFQVIGFVAALESELGLEGLKPSELREIEKEIAAGNVPPNYTLEKPKRGLAKVSNTDGATFNHITSSTKPVYTATQQTSYPVQPSYTPAQQVYPQAEAAAAYSPANSAYSTNPAAAVQQTYTPLRYVYNNQYFPANQYLSYLQNPQLQSQIAAQYSYQPHYLQTPTQVQYVSPPNYSAIPSSQYKAPTSKAAATTQTQTSSAAAANVNQASSQVVLPSNGVVSPVQYQQPLFMYILPQQVAPQQYYHPQQHYQAQQQMLLLGGGNPLLGLYNQQHRFTLPYTSPLANQVSTQRTLIPTQLGRLLKTNWFIKHQLIALSMRNAFT